MSTFYVAAANQRRLRVCGLKDVCQLTVSTIASPIRRYGPDTIYFKFKLDFVSHFDWVFFMVAHSCVFLVTLMLVLHFLCALLRVSSLSHVLCYNFVMVSQP